MLLELTGRPVLVVGGGTVAAAKAAGLVQAGARVHLVATWFHPAALALPGVIRSCRPYRSGDLHGVWLVVSAVDDPAVSAAVAADAQAARIFCNAADRPEFCSATMMAIHRSGPLTVAVSTGGRSPAAAAWLRDRLAEPLDGALGRVVELAGQARDRVRGRRSSEGLGWRDLLDGLFADLEARDEPAAHRRVEHFAASAAPDLSVESGSVTVPAPVVVLDSVPAPAPVPTPVPDSGLEPEVVHADDVRRHRPMGGSDAAIRPALSEAPAGRVWLVGAGPGSADLLTLGAARALAQAEVVVHDALVGDAVFELISPDTRCIDVGKRPGAVVAQEEINELLVRLARDGLRVVRLKGGDPYLFGRGGEEALALQAAGVAFEVIPGVSSALAAPALAGVPVTHRGVSVAVTVITGHRAGSFAPVDWESVARVGGTLVVLMGVTERAAIADGLQRGGLDPDTPVAIVERASQPDSIEIRTTLAQLGATAVSAPAVLVIGAVAAFDLRSVTGRV